MDVPIPSFTFPDPATFTQRYINVTALESWALATSNALRQANEEIAVLRSHTTALHWIAEHRPDAVKDFMQYIAVTNRLTEGEPHA